MSTSSRKASKTVPELLGDGGKQDNEVPGGDPDVDSNANKALASGTDESLGDEVGDMAQSSDGPDQVTGPQGGSSDADLADPAIAPGHAHRVSPGEVEVYPRRTYHDEGELRRRGGKGYVVSKRHADALVLRGLASLEGAEE